MDIVGTKKNLIGILLLTRKYHSDNLNELEKIK